MEVLLKKHATVISKYFEKTHTVVACH